MLLGRALQIDRERVVLKRRRFIPGEWAVLNGDEQTVGDLITDGSLHPGSEIWINPVTCN